MECCRDSFPVVGHKVLRQEKGQRKRKRERKGAQGGEAARSLLLRKSNPPLS